MNAPHTEVKRSTEEDTFDCVTNAPCLFYIPAPHVYIEISESLPSKSFKSNGGFADNIVANKHFLYQA